MRLNANFKVFQFTLVKFAAVHFDCVKIFELRYYLIGTLFCNPLEWVRKRDTKSKQNLAAMVKV